jgi:hypothetical protein
MMEVAVLRKKKEPKAKKSVAEALLHDMHAGAAEKLAAFEKLRSRGHQHGVPKELCAERRERRSTMASPSRQHTIALKFTGVENASGKVVQYSGYYPNKSGVF